VRCGGTFDSRPRLWCYRWLEASRQRAERSMQIDLIAIQPIVALIAGILILIIPRLLNFIVAIYLIFIGVMGLLGTGGLENLGNRIGL